MLRFRLFDIEKVSERDINKTKIKSKLESERKTNNRLAVVVVVIRRARLRGNWQGLEASKGKSESWSQSLVSV